VVPVGRDPLPDRVVTALPDRLTERLRALGAVPATAGLDVRADAGGVTVEAEQERFRGPGVDHGGVVSVRVAATGTVSVHANLPTDRMSTSALDRGDAAGRIARALRLAHGLHVVDADRVALAAGLGPLLMVAEMDPALLAAGAGSSRTMKMADSVRVVPDESVNLDALLGATAELADGLAARLLDGFRKSR